MIDNIFKSVLISRKETLNKNSLKSQKIKIRSNDEKKKQSGNTLRLLRLRHQPNNGI